MRSMKPSRALGARRAGALAVALLPLALAACASLIGLEDATPDDGAATGSGTGAGTEAAGTSAGSPTSGTESTSTGGDGGAGSSTSAEAIAVTVTGSGGFDLPPGV